jgi:cobalt-zinc-cadmium efflux system protein
MSHDHGAQRAGGRRRLTIVLGATSAFMLAEAAAGRWTGSLALLADAGHMLSDVAGLALALVAMKIAERPATARRTYGYYRVEILAALANATALVGISVLVLWQAVRRLREPPPVASGAMMAVAGAGLVVNLAGVWLLREGSDRSLNIKGAYFEVLSDLLSSLGALVAGAVMWTTGWYYADPIVSAGIGLFILPRTWLLVREATAVLLEGAPRGVDLGALRAAMEAVPGVARVHDLHAWSITSGMHALSAHAVLDDGAAHDEVRLRLQRCVAEFGIHHITLQLEAAHCGDERAHP